MRHSPAIDLMMTLGLLVVLVAGSGCGGGMPVVPAGSTDTPTAPVEPVLTATQVAPSPTQTPSRTVIPTFTPRPTFTAARTPTRTRTPTETPEPLAPDPAPPGDVTGSITGESARPSGADEQLSYGGSPLSPGCGLVIRPGQSSAACNTTIPVWFALYFQDFNDGAISVRIQRPDGRLRPASPVQLRVRDGRAQWEWVLPIEDPPGDYTVIATQGALRSTAAIRVAAPDRPRLVVFPHTGPPGSTFGLYLAGFPANGNVKLHVYQQRVCSDRDALCGDYRTSLTVHTNARGRGYYTFNTRATDAERSYRLVADHPAYGSSRDPWANLALQR
jgi:hypothetical protein